MKPLCSLFYLVMPLAHNFVISWRFNFSLLMFSSWELLFSSFTYPIFFLTKITCSSLEPTWIPTCCTDLLSLPLTFGISLTSNFIIHCFSARHHCHNNALLTCSTWFAIFLYVHNNLSSHVHIVLCLLFLMCTNMLFVPPNLLLIPCTHLISCILYFFD